MLFMGVERKLAKSCQSNDELGREVDACRKELKSDNEVAVGRFRELWICH